MLLLRSGRARVPWPRRINRGPSARPGLSRDTSVPVSHPAPQPQLSLGKGQTPDRTGGTPEAGCPPSALFMFEAVLEEKCENAFQNMVATRGLPGRQGGRTIGASA